jgi:2-methylisocitrate lyase-like PEP mutase family enzyme
MTTANPGPAPAARQVTAARLRDLHVPGDPLLLPNVWDAASARLVEAAGFPVVATGSAAVAESLGHPDHEGAPPAEMFAAAGRIARAVSVPVTVDVESGYGLAPAELAARLADAGAVGCNLEDTDHAGGGLADAAAQANRIAALRAADPDLVINARVDAFVHAGDQRAALGDGIDRARAYLAAGADCVYPILVREAGVLAEFVDALRPAAVNALYLPGGPDLAALGTLGVARISLGAGLWRHVRSHLETSLRRLAGGVAPY